MSTGEQPPLRRAPIPLREPRAATTVSSPGGTPLPPTQGTLALALGWDAAQEQSPRQAPAQSRAGKPDASRPGASGPGVSGPGVSGPGVSGRAEAGRYANGPAGARPVGVMPEPREWAATFAQAAMEAAFGIRPVAQLVRWTTPDVQLLLTRRAALARRAGRRLGVQVGKPRLRTLVIGSPSARVREVAAVVTGPERVRAVAFRMEGYHGRWRVTALDIG